MRAFVILSACLAAAAAQPFATSNSKAIAISETSAGGPQVTIEKSDPIHQEHVGGGNKVDFPPRTFFPIVVGGGVIATANSFATAYNGAGAYAGSKSNVDIFELPTEVKKSYYYHASKDSHAGARAKSNAFVEIQPKTHYKVLFIKAPSASADAYAIARAAARTRTQEKTLVYVLSHDVEAEAKALADAAVDTYQSATPEVRFVKYKGAGATAVATAQAQAEAHAAHLQAIANGEAVATTNTNAYANANAGLRIINQPRFAYQGNAFPGNVDSQPLNSNHGTLRVIPQARFEYNGGNARASADAGSNSFHRSFQQSGGVSFGATPTFVEQL